jgi:hypothetical protein
MNQWGIRPGTLQLNAPRETRSAGIWGSIRSAGLGGLADLLVHPQVRRFQQLMNRLRNSTSAAFSTGVGPLDEDGKWGDDTQAAAKRLADWFYGIGLCAGVSSERVDSLGPANMRNCLRSMSSWATANLRSAGTPGLAANLISSVGPLSVWTSDGVEELQTAFVEYRSSAYVPGPGGSDLVPDPYASARAACAASGGTWDAVNHTCTPADAFAGERANCAAAGGTWDEAASACSGAASHDSTRGIAAFLTLGLTSVLVVGTAHKW